MGRLNRAVSIIGLLVFGGLFLLTTLAPATVERTARAFVLSEVRDRLAPVLESKSGQKLQSAYKGWKDKRSGEEALGESDAVADVAKQLAPIIEKLCHYNCKDRAALEAKVETGLRGALSATAKARDKIAAAAKTKFQVVVTKVRRDLMIFAGANVAVFALLLWTTFLGPRASRALVLPSFFLTVSTLVCAGIYLFGQNWFYTVLFDNYLGYSYLTMVTILAVFFFFVFRVRSGKADRRVFPGAEKSGLEEIVVMPLQGGAAASDSLGAFGSCAEAVVGCAEAVVDAFVGLLAAG